MKTPEKLREELYDLLRAVDDHDLAVENEDGALEKILIIFEREKKSACEEILTRLNVPELIDEWGAIDHVLEDMFPSKK